MIHDLKCWPEQFDALFKGTKAFDARKNDRNFKNGDVLQLREWKPADGFNSNLGDYTGREILCRVTFILHGIEENRMFGLEKGFCIMSLQKLSKRAAILLHKPPTIERKQHVKNRPVA